MNSKRKSIYFMVTQPLKYPINVDCNEHCPSLIATASLYGNEEVLDFLKAELQIHPKVVSPVDMESKYDIKRSSSKQKY